jgi:hypothetical protein
MLYTASQNQGMSTADFVLSLKYRNQSVLSTKSPLCKAYNIIFFQTCKPIIAKEMKV